MEGTEKAPFFCSQRFVLVIMAFLGALFNYTLRVNLSLAIICMVRSDVSQSNLTLPSNVTVTNNTAGTCGESADDPAVLVPNESAEFDWDKSTRSQLLAMYFYGYICTQILGGWLASRYGGKHIWSVCMFISALCAIVTPVSARTHVYLAYAVRFILGLAAGVTFPCVQALLGQWAPPFERSKMAAIIFAAASSLGPHVGNIVTFSISGVLCEYGFDNGWGSIFYLAGILSLIWVLAWHLLIANSPAQHPRISEQEKLYLQSALGKGVVTKVRRVPWLKMFTSGPLWAVIAGHLCTAYTIYTLMTSLPTFMKESLNFDVKQNGALSSLPYLCQSLTSIGVGYLTDFLIARGFVSTKIIRKSFQCILRFLEHMFGLCYFSPVFTSPRFTFHVSMFMSRVHSPTFVLWSAFLGIAVCSVCIGEMNCETRLLAVALLCFCTMFIGFSMAGYMVNHLDLAPSYAGVLFGITNTAATIPGMVAPLIAGILTPNGTAEEWRHVFYVCAAVATAGALIYFILADGKLQPWAIPEGANLELRVIAAIPVKNVSDTQKDGAGDGEADIPSIGLYKIT